MLSLFLLTVLHDVTNSMYYLILIMMYQFITKISDDQHTTSLLSQAVSQTFPKLTEPRR